MQQASVPTLILSLALPLALAACGGLNPVGGAPAAPMMPAEATMRPLPRPDGPAVAEAAAVPTAGGQTVAALDTTTAAEKAEAMAAPVAGGARLGTVAVALGSPVEPGFWLRAKLIKAPGKGRVVLDSGAAIAVDLVPGEGAAQLSLAAYRALGLALTDLPEVTVYTE